jgi:hypothetical protein
MICLCRSLLTTGILEEEGLGGIVSLESSLAEESLDLGPGLGGTMGRSPWPGVEARSIGIVSTISVNF